MIIKNIGKTLVILTVVSLLGISATAFAGKGKGSASRNDRNDQSYGRYGCDGSAYDSRHKGWSGRQGRGLNLSDEQIKKIDEERKSFFNSTQDLRRDIHQKWLELNAEIAKKDPDSAKASALQKELSTMKAQLEQARTEHRLRMGKISPDLGKMGANFHGNKGFKGNSNKAVCR